MDPCQVPYVGHNITIQLEHMWAMREGPHSAWHSMLSTLLIEVLFTAVISQFFYLSLSLMEHSKCSSDVSFVSVSICVM